MKDKREIIITNNFQETQKFAEKYIFNWFKDQVSKNGLVIALYGDLGSGKTTFIQGIAKGLGIKKRILSPTFIILRSYEVLGSSLNFYHIDLYRMEKEDDLKGLGLNELLSDPLNIVAIEWAEKMADLLPKERIDIKFEYLEKDKRKIIIEDKRIF